MPLLDEGLKNGASDNKDTGQRDINRRTEIREKVHSLIRAGCTQKRRADFSNNLYSFGQEELLNLFLRLSTIIDGKFSMFQVHD